MKGLDQSDKNNKEHCTWNA